MRQPFIAAIGLAAAITVAGCGQQKTVDVKNESVSGVAQKVADSGLRMQPGRWESTMKFAKLALPPEMQAQMDKMPPDARAVMQQSMGGNRVFASCLTKADAEKPGGKFFGQANQNCTYERFTMGGGKIDAKLSCKLPNGVQNMAMNGSYTPDSYTMTMAVEGHGGNGHEGMSMTMDMSAKRTGECTGKEDS